MKITHDDIRRVGGIVHGDGNIFFTNIDKLQQLQQLEPLQVVYRQAPGRPGVTFAIYGASSVHYANELERQIAELQKAAVERTVHSNAVAEAQEKKIAELEALSVTNIMLQVVPGWEGEGVEIYAKSVADVEQLLGSQDERLENFELGIDIAKPVKDRIEKVEAHANFQQLVKPWMLACFGEKISADKGERNHRYLEESLELVQACGCTKEEALQLVDYVYGRPLGEPHQEVGGAMVTLAALCLAQELNMHEAGATELKRIWTKVEQIRAKQASKPKYSPLPEHPKGQP